MTKVKIDRQKVYEKFGGHCSYCGREITIKQMQVDHMWPLHREFSLRMNYQIDVHSISNLMPACRKCNHYKRGYNLEQFRHSMKTLHERLAKIYILEVACNFGMASVKPFDGTFYFEKL